MGLRSFTHPDFWACYHRLPKQIQNLAAKKFDLFKKDHKHLQPGFQLPDSGIALGRFFGDLSKIEQGPGGMEVFMINIVLIVRCGLFQLVHP